MNKFNSSPGVLHYPVMLNEVIKLCNPQKGGNYLDCTFGSGGYSKKILKFKNTNVTALDRDKTVNLIAEDLKKKYPKRFNFFNEKFSNLDKIKFSKKFDVIIFDLALSSMQLKDYSRGFSFKSKDKLDMNMGLSSRSAEFVINNYKEKDLNSIIKIFGDEKESLRIAKSIVRYRSTNKITKVNQLVEIIEKSKKNFSKKINKSTKTFQAIRIFVNREISELIEGVMKATKILKKDGKLVVISFQSIEDKIIKYFFKNYSLNNSRPSRYFPINENEFLNLFMSYQNKVFKPSEKEIKINPPSRSAKLRFAIRNDNKFSPPLEFKLKFKKYLDIENTNA